MLNTIIAYFARVCNRTSKTYGSDLERYIVSKQPQTIYDVEYWTNQFDKRYTQKGWSL